MIDVIKKVVKNYMNNADLTMIQYGTIVNVNPIQIQIEKLVIPNKNIVVPSVFEKVGISLDIGDKVLLLRNHGGQLFYLLDKV